MNHKMYMLKPEEFSLIFHRGMTRRYSSRLKDGVYNLRPGMVEIMGVTMAYTDMDLKRERSAPPLNVIRTHGGVDYRIEEDEGFLKEYGRLKIDGNEYEHFIKNLHSQDYVKFLPENLLGKVENMAVSSDMGVFVFDALITRTAFDSQWMDLEIYFEVRGDIQLFPNHRQENMGTYQPGLATSLTPFNG